MMVPAQGLSRMQLHSESILAFCGRAFRLPLALVTFLWGAAPALAVEGSTAAGPVGGTDVRSAFLPPPGWYGGMIGFASDAPVIVDGHGHKAAGLEAAHLTIKAAAPFLIYVPDVKVLGGSIGVIGVAPYGAFCG